MKCARCWKILSEIEEKDNENDVLKYCGDCLDDMQGLL